VKFDATIPPTSLQDIPQLTRAAEEIGFDALWSPETQHDPFLPMALVAEHSQRLNFGTAVAIGFARSPATLAYTAWDLSQASGGRFILGLGTQVRAHIERRFGMSWPPSPLGKLRELIGAIRALWSTWQTGESLRFRGEYFNLSLMSPFFNPGPIDHPEIPIYIAGVNTGMCRLAGEMADGFHVHPFHSESYLRKVIRPAIAEGAARANRSENSLKLSAPVMNAESYDLADFVRSQIAFYASTPSYRPVMAHHGWGEEADQLRELARGQHWGEMPGVIRDEMLDTFAVIAPENELADAIKARYTDLVHRVNLYQPYQPGVMGGFWHRMVTDMREGS
jgi:probable F420-dependent oxidoreductase